MSGELNAEGVMTALVQRVTENWHAEVRSQVVRTIDSISIDCQFSYFRQAVAAELFARLFTNQADIDPELPTAAREAKEVVDCRGIEARVKKAIADLVGTPRA